MMRSRRRAVAALVGSAWLGAVFCIGSFTVGPATAQSAMPPGAQRFQVVEIIDRNGFERPIPAARVMVPMGWQTQGAVVWNPQTTCQADAARFEWAAGDPRGVGAVEIMPGTAWQSSNLPPQFQSAGGCTNAAIADIRQYLEALVQVRRPGAVVLDFRPRPDESQKLNAMLGPQQSMPGMEYRAWAEAGEVLIGYRYQSQNIREIIGASAIFNHTRMADAMGGVMEFLSGTALPAFAMRAPDGAMDFQLYETIRKSVKLDEGWQARMNKHNQTIAQINAKGARERSRITAQASDDISTMIHEGWKKRQAIMDKSQENWSLGMREQELYNDPQMGEQVELPSTYNHAWRLQDGSYLMTDNPNLNPNVEFGINATELQRAQ